MARQPVAFSNMTTVRRGHPRLTTGAARRRNRHTGSATAQAENPRPARRRRIAQSTQKPERPETSHRKRCDAWRPARHDLALLISIERRGIVARAPDRMAAVQFPRHAAGPRLRARTLADGRALQLSASTLTTGQ